MKFEKLKSSETSRAVFIRVFTSLQSETRATVDTETAAYHLSRRPQTLRAWSCHQNGPLSPLQINGRLAWRVADLKRILGVE